MTNEQPKSIIPEADLETCSLTGDTGCLSVQPAMIGSIATSRPPEMQDGFVSADYGTCPTQHQSHLTNEDKVRSEVPVDDTAGTNRVPTTDSGKGQGNDGRDGAPTDALRSRPKRLRRRSRKAHWKAMIGDVDWRFCYDPDANVIVIRKRGTPSRKNRTVTMAELLELLGGQRILHL